jgi:NAD(P)H-nitrite reductase large subunit
MSMLCGCKTVTFQDVLTAISKGADTADKVAEITGAGTDCGKCKALVANVIALGR